MLKSIKEANIVEGTIVLVRTDWNVPVKDGVVLDTSRIEMSVPTIDYALKKGAKVIVLSHFGDGSDSIELVAKEAEKFFEGVNIRFVRDPWNTSSPDGRQSFENLRSGEIAVFENLRFWMEKENSDEFAEQLAAFGDIYVNEAFPVSHRKHTSIVKLPKLLPHFAGFGFMEEYQKLSLAFNPEHPFLFILGGAKFETKLPLVEKFLSIADQIFIGGEIAFHALSLPLAQNPKIVLPIGNITALDANQETLDLLQRKIAGAKFILWNGPLGNYENGYKQGTLALAKMLAESDAQVIVGGGDTVASIKELDLKDKFYFISTAGGAMLDFLSNGTLPGIEALEG
jgi:3-phosphoglycerate kinase